MHILRDNLRKFLTTPMATEAELDLAILENKEAVTQLRTRVNDKVADLQKQIDELKATHPDLSDELASVLATTAELRAILAPATPPPAEA